MDTLPYQIGQQVRLTLPCLGIHAGAVGVITFMYPTVRHLYRVYFATLDIAVSLHSSAFERTASPSAPVPGWRRLTL